jgi:hypothetical protein
MWLPRDERRLLAGYSRNFDRLDEPYAFKLTELCKLLTDRGATLGEYGECDSQEPSGGAESFEAMKASIERHVDERARVSWANEILAKRGLISIVPHEGESDVVVIKLALPGYDLGRRYASFWNSSGLWFQEFRNHWIWLIVSFVGGALGALAVDALRASFS